MSVTSRVTIPEAKPAFELVDDRLVQKVSPRLNHGRLQFALMKIMDAWAAGRGRVSLEWRFVFDELPRRTSLVPDVAYLSYDRLPSTAREAAQEPHVAPDLAIEILSPSDWRELVNRKRELYLASGTTAVMEIDPAQRTVTLHDRGGRRVHRDGEVVEHAAFPGLRIDVTELFDSVE